MQCSSCGTPLSPNGAYCPTCGAVIPSHVAHAEISPYDPMALPTSRITPQVPPPPPPPPTFYGSPAYEVSQHNPYDPLNPYAVPAQEPPPRRPQHHTKLSLVIGMVILILALIGGAVFVSLALQAKSLSTRSASTPPTSLPQTTLTVSATSNSQEGTMVYPPYRGTLVLDDPLHNNSQGYNWQEINETSGSCTFTQGAYHASTQAGYFYACTAHDADFDNFAYEVQMKILRGDCGALLFRVDSSVTKFYYFRVCQDGSSALFLYSGSTGLTLIPSHSNAAMNAGLKQSNLIAVVARGKTLDLYINQQHVDSTDDSTLSRGQIGVVADGYPGNHPTEVVYNNIRVWKL